jgi:hypothetical protein
VDAVVKENVNFVPAKTLETVLETALVSKKGSHSKKKTEILS